MRSCRSRILRELTAVFLTLLIAFRSHAWAGAACPKADFLSLMISKVKWSCIFPLYIGTMKFGSGEDTDDHPDDWFCQCDDGKWGIKMSFWEPIRLIEVVREPYCFPVLSFGMSDTGKSVSPADLAHHGTDSWCGEPTEDATFYHVHYYVFPVWVLLGIGSWFISQGVSSATFGIFPDLSKCFSGLQDTGLSIDAIDSLDIFVLTELDPAWNDDIIALYLSPEAAVFGSPPLQAVCAADCIAATADFPIDQLFWCAGCWGGMYPYAGYVPYGNDGIPNSALLAARIVARLSREMIEGVTTASYCHSYPTGFIKKSQYKLQLVYPKTSSCIPLGRSALVWGQRKTYPRKGVDFVYLLWRKKLCCAR